MKFVRGLLCFLLLSFSCNLLLAETWYVRTDGGTRYSSKAKLGQCDGKADKPYPGTGVNQPCAFNDVRYLWTDGTYTLTTDPSAFPAWGWIGKGGDTYMVRGGPWRVGQSGPNPRDGFGLMGNPYGSGPPAIPAGTASKHTKFLGEHFNACNATNKTQLFGGFGVYAVLDLQTSFVDMQCIELTRHSTCIRVGNPPVPKPCKKDYPVDDYATNGIVMGPLTHDLLLQDVWVHGFTTNGIVGSISGLVTMKHVDIAFNGAAGWDLDDGHSMAKSHPALDFDDVTIEWSGCNQTYNGKGAISCYSQSSSGYGDGIGAPSGSCVAARVNHSTFRYNTQDGFDFLHNDSGGCPLTITNSSSYGNSGGQFKWGAGSNPVVFSHNVAMGNCSRLSAPMKGAAPYYNTNVSDFCRGEDTIIFYVSTGGNAQITNNTFVSYEPTTIDFGCAGKNCATALVKFDNNIILGYDNPRTYNLGGKEGGPGSYYSEHPVEHVQRSNNIYWGVRETPCSLLSPTEQCVDPKFINQPAKFKREEDLDNFNFHRGPGAPIPTAGAFPL